MWRAWKLWGAWLTLVKASAARPCNLAARLASGCKAQRPHGQHCQLLLQATEDCICHMGTLTWRGRMLMMKHAAD